MFCYLTLNKKNLLISDNSNDKEEFLLENKKDGTTRIKVNNLYLHENGTNDRKISIKYQTTDDFSKFIFEKEKNGNFKIKCVGSNRYIHEYFNKELRTYNQHKKNITYFRLEPIQNTNKFYIKIQMKKKLLYIDKLWWPFGSHINHIFWSKIYAKKNNFTYFYRKNLLKINPKDKEPFFTNGNFEKYFEKVSDIMDFETEYNIFIYKHTIYTGYEIQNFKPEKYKSIKEYHSNLLKKIARPSKFIQEKLNNHKFLNEIKKLNGKYIAVHIRWSDKIRGKGAETTEVSLKFYLEYCVQMRKELKINTIVLCSDTIEGIQNFLEFNKKSEYNFDILYDRDEFRVNNTPEDSFVQSILKKNFKKFKRNEYIENEYITCFAVFTILLESASIIGNLDSAMCLIPNKIRNNPKVDKSVTCFPGCWDLCGGRFYSEAQLRRLKGLS